MSKIRIEVRDYDMVLLENEQNARVAACEAITEILLSSALGAEQLRELCNRVEREISD